MIITTTAAMNRRIKQGITTALAIKRIFE